jgi:hypothetical protein
MVQDMLETAGACLTLCPEYVQDVQKLQKQMLHPALGMYSMYIFRRNSIGKSGTHVWTCTVHIRKILSPPTPVFMSILYIQY